MSVAGILSSGLFNYAAQSVNNNVQQFRQEFQQLGQDLQSGNLSAAGSAYSYSPFDVPKIKKTNSGGKECQRTPETCWNPQPNLPQAVGRR